MMKKTAPKLSKPDVEKPMIEFFLLNKNNKNSRKTELNEIIFVQKGNYILESSLHGNVNLKKGEGIFLPSECKYEESGKECIIIVIRLEHPTILKYCKCTSSEQPTKEPEQNNKPFTLIVNSLLEKYLDNLYQYLTDQVGCALLYDIKIKELIYILTQSYPEATIANFFYTDHP